MSYDSMQSDGEVSKWYDESCNFEVESRTAWINYKFYLSDFLFWFMKVLQI